MRYDGDSMAAMLPIRFIPFVRPMVWGGRRLGEMLSKPLATGENYGESWEVSDHPMHCSIVAAGRFAGQTLAALLEQHRASLLGPAATACTTFPWLIKFLDCHDWLSVQVHPDEQKVQQWLPGEGSKTEAWFVLDALPGSRIYAGLLPGIHEPELRAALASKTVTACLHSFEPRPGDCIFLSAGTVHAVGGGVLMAEVQQTSDATFRLFDWNRLDAQGRSRPLHIEESLACMDWQRGPVKPVTAAGYASGARDRVCQDLVSCPYFSLQFLRESEPFSCGATGRLQALLVLRGRGRWGKEAKDGSLLPGQVWILPAAMSQLPCCPEGWLEMLLCTLP